MPLTRYQIRNEYSLADSELYRAADKDDPEALLEGVAMAGLVGVLRQLGDLAEFAAEIFHDLHEEVMATAARGHGLTVRVQQLEAEFPSIEKALLCQTNHSLFYHNTGIDWHPNLPMDQNLIAQGDLPRFIMDSYEECRGPPRLFLLDKFDVAGTGSCLKRYTDPSFFKMDPPPLFMKTEVQRETKTRKAKKKGSRWRAGETPEVLSTSHAKLHQLFLEESVENHINNPACRVKLKRRLNGFPYDSRTGKSYMEKLFQTSTPGPNVVYEISGDSSPLKLPSNLMGEPGSEILEISMVSPGKESVQRKGSPCSSPDFDETEEKPSTNMLTEEEADFGISEVSKQNNMSEADAGLSTTLHEEVHEEEIMVDQERKIQVSTDSYQSDDIASEVESYMDALATMDSEMETDTECKTKDDQHLLKTKNQGIGSEANEEQHEFCAQFSDSRSIGNSTATDDGNSLSRKGISISSYSDSVSNLAEITPSNGHASAKFLPSSEIYVAEIVNMSSDQCSVNGESLSFEPVEHITGDGVYIEEAKIPNYRPGFREASSHSYFTDLTSINLPVDEGQSSIEGASGEPQLDEILLNLNEHNVGLGNNEDSMNVGANVNLSEVIPRAGDDFVRQVSAQGDPADEIDKQQPQVLSHVSLQLPGILKLAPEKESSENLLNNSPEAAYAEDESRKKLVSWIGSPLSVASCTQEQPVVSDFPEVEVSTSSSPGLGEPSSRTCLAGSAPMLLRVDVGNKSKEGAHMGAEVDEVSSNNNEPSVGNNNPEEDGMHANDGFPSISNLSDDLSQTRDGFTHDLSAEMHPAGELGEEEPYILHDASLHCPHIIEQAPEKKGSENLLDNVLDAEFEGDDCSQVSFDNQIDSSCLVAQSTEKQLLSSALPELETCDSNVKPNNTISEVDNTLPLSAELAISSNPVLDSPRGNYFTKQEFIEVTEHVTSLEPDSTEPVSSYSKEKNLYGALIEADVECGFSSDIHIVRKEASDLQFPSDVPNCPDPSPFQKSCVQLLDDIAANNVQSEDMIMATAVANTGYDDNEDNGKGESSSAVKLQEESISILQDLHDETDLPGHLQAIGTEKEEDQHTVASSDLNSVRSDNVPYDCSNLELLDSIPDLSIAGISQDNLHIVNVGELLPCSDLNDQDSELNARQSNVVASAEDDVGSPSNQVPELLTLEGKADLPAGQLDLENLHATQGNSEPFFEVEQMQFSNHLDQGHTDASSDISAVHVQSLPSVSGFEQQLAVSDQTKDPSSPLLPSLGLLPEASQISLDEMPPLPPLPPAQWRKGNILRPALVPENNLIQHNLDPFPQILISTAEEKNQFSHIAMEGENKYSNPFLPLSTVNDEHFQLVNESVAGYMVHSSPLSLQASNTTNDRNIEDDFPSSSGIQSMNVCAVLPTTVNDERSEQGYLALEQGTTKATLNPFSPKTNEAVVSTCPISSPEVLIQPVHQSVEQIISEENHLGTSVISEGKIMSPPDTTFPPQIMQDNEPHHDFATSGGQITGPSNTSILPAPSDERNPNGNQQQKLPRPRNPLIDAVIAHDKSKLRKVTERLRPQIEQKPDKRDSLLEQIRTKSFNLKPAVGTRPSIQAPKTNLKVAAILEKANAIRQALAGSDEEDDEDGWSDA